MPKPNEPQKDPQLNHGLCRFWSRWMPGAISSPKKNCYKSAERTASVVQQCPDRLQARPLLSSILQPSKACRDSPSRNWFRTKPIAICTSACQERRLCLAARPLTSIVSSSPSSSCSRTPSQESQSCLLLPQFSTCLTFCLSRCPCCGMFWGAKVSDQQHLVCCEQPLCSDGSARKAGRAQDPRS